MNLTLTTSNLTVIQGEPRVLDTDLAEALGFAKAADIKGLIRRHIVALERFGEVFGTVRKTSSKGGRPSKDYWLSKKQALYLCTKSEAKNATEVTIQMVEVFDAFLSNRQPGTPIDVTNQNWRYTRSLRRAKQALVNSVIRLHELGYDTSKVVAPVVTKYALGIDTFDGARQ